MHIVQLGKYRLDANHVGEGWTVILTKAFTDPREAMLELHRLIVTDGAGLRPTTYEIVADGVTRMSLNEFYEHTYSVRPHRRADGSYGYPRLKQLEATR